MKLKRLLSIALALVLGAGSLFGANVAIEVRAEDNEEISAEEIPAEDVSVTWEESRVYKELSLGNFQTITTYGVAGYEDVPFVSADQYLRVLYEGKEKVLMEDGVMKITMNGAEAVIDPAADTISIENPAKFNNSQGVDGSIVDDVEYNVITVSTKHESTQSEADPIVIDLKNYHMPVIPYEDTVLLPFLALQNTFGAIRMDNGLAYNGKDYFNAHEADLFILDEHEEAKESPYFKAIYSGPFSKKQESTKAYAEYGYYSICLLLDLTFGHKEEKNITTFDEYFTRMNAKEALCSTDPSYATTAEFMLFNYLFDSGHDSVLGNQIIFGTELAADPADVSALADNIKESAEGGQYFDNGEESIPEAGAANPGQDAIVGALLEKGFKIPEIAPLIVWGYGVKIRRPEDFGDHRLDYADDTAVIYFNHFQDDTSTRKPSYYLDAIKDEDAENSTFAFFYQCFEDIKQHEEVKNVVINLADNGGGAAAALVSVLGFLSEDGEVLLTNQDLLAGNYREEWYHIDTNLDGVADDQDGYGGEYNFYILCSGSSYSCGNALPYFAQKDGLATIIGARPGGGDCVVNTFVDAYGRCAVYSGMLKLGTMENGEFISDEHATTLDLNMMPSILDIVNVPWYDAAGIADAVHQYENGATEIVYSDKTDSEKISEYVMKLLEKIEQLKEEQEKAQLGN